MRSDAILATTLAAALLALLPLIVAGFWVLTGSRIGAILLGSVAKLIDQLNAIVGNGVMWLTIAMVVVQVTIVTLRYVFGEGRVFLQELMLYMNGALFLAASGYTLLREGHVRVDIFYRGASPRGRAIVDVIGTYLFLFPVTIILFAVSFPYVRQSWLFLEGSRETGGIPFVYGLKTFILIFCALLFLQGLSQTIHNLRRLAGLDPFPPPQPKIEG
jgi:TRAP-type mannitol/chloroaromatic compound transport system permease small subunit